MRILVAANDGTLFNTIGGMLNRLGHEAVEAVNSRQAMDLLLHDEFPVLIAGPEMADIDFSQLRSRTQKRAPYTIALVEASFSEGEQEGALDAADDFLPKPFTEAQLATRLEAAERVLARRAAVTPQEGIVTVCSYCNRIRNAQGAWVEPWLSLYADPRLMVSHGICPDCYEQILKPQIDEIKHQIAMQREVPVYA